MYFKYILAASPSSSPHRKHLNIDTKMIDNNVDYGVIRSLPGTPTINHSPLINTTRSDYNYSQLNPPCEPLPEDELYKKPLEQVLINIINRIQHY